jgi:hypothetical protein
VPEGGGCGHVHIETGAHEQYRQAVNDAQRIRNAAPPIDRDALREAVVRIEHAGNQMDRCVREPEHERPHRAANGYEWWHEPEEDPAEVYGLMPKTYPAHEVMPEGTTPRPEDHEDDPMWSDLFQRVQVEISLPENMRLLLKPDQAVEGGRWYYQIECDRPDTLTGIMGTGRGGKAYLTPHMPAGELAQIAFGLGKGYTEHEFREAFKWRGRRIFGPHIDPEALWGIAERTTYRA